MQDARLLRRGNHVAAENASRHSPQAPSDSRRKPLKAITRYVGIVSCARAEKARAPICRGSGGGVGPTVAVGLQPDDRWRDGGDTNGEAQAESPKCPARRRGASQGRFGGCAGGSDFV